MRLLDLACGAGRHAIAAASLGARVTAVDRDRAALAAGQARAERAGISIEWCEADLEAEWWPEPGRFDVVLLFNYLDRSRMADVRELVAPGGLLLMETFLESQRGLGWGPKSPDHLLAPGEIGRLVTPLAVLFGREVLEPVGADRVRAVASVVAGTALKSSPP